MLFSLLLLALHLNQPGISLAFEPGESELLVCEASGGGQVHVAADSAKRVSLEFTGAASETLGLKRDAELPATLEAVDSGSTAGAVDSLEVGAGFFTNTRVGRYNCGLGLKFMPQLLETAQPIALNRRGQYHFVKCESPGGEKRQLDILSCKGANGVASATDLKKYLKIEIGD